MLQQPIQACEKCIDLLSESTQHFKRVEYLKKLTKISKNQKYHKISLFLYCLYSILHKFDYVEALQAIQKSQSVNEGSMISISMAKLIRALLYTYIDKHRDSLTLLKEACSLMKSLDSVSLQMKNFYKKMIPLIISNLDTSNGKKSFYKFFNEIYDELAKQSSENQLNEEILYSIHSQIQFLKTKIDVVPTISNSTTKNHQNSLQKSLSGTKITHKTNSFHQSQENDYMEFSKPQTIEEKSVNNIKKMIESKKQMRQNLQQSKSSELLNKGLTGFGKKTFQNNLLKNQPNPYQLNLYVEQKPHCQFL